MGVVVLISFVATLLSCIVNLVCVGVFVLFVWRLWCTLGVLWGLVWVWGRLGGLLGCCGAFGDVVVFVLFGSLFVLCPVFIDESFWGRILILCLIYTRIFLMALHLPEFIFGN